MIETLENEPPKIQDENHPSQIIESLQSAMAIEFPELRDMDKVDIVFLWTENGRDRFRINGWEIERIGDYKIVFSKFVVAWWDDGNVTYKVKG